MLDTTQSVTDYTVVSAIYTPRLDLAAVSDKLERQVRVMIGQGWQPLGAPSSAAGDGTILFAQAMVRRGA